MGITGGNQGDKRTQKGVEVEKMSLRTPWDEHEYKAEEDENPDAWGYEDEAEAEAEEFDEEEEL
jgi:hypothetical protein